MKMEIKNRACCCQLNMQGFASEAALGPLEICWQFQIVQVEDAISERNKAKSGIIKEETEFDQFLVNWIQTGNPRVANK